MNKREAKALLNKLIEAYEVGYSDKLLIDMILEATKDQENPDDGCVTEACRSWSDV